MQHEAVVAAVDAVAAAHRIGVAGIGGQVVEATALPPSDSGHGRNWVELVVTDTGEGMTDQVKRQAIEPFFTTRSLAESTGLGLSMVYGFVTQSGGEVRIDSTQGEGTRVTLRFPRLDPSTVTPSVVRRPVVLLVEDDPGVRRRRRPWPP